MLEKLFREKKFIITGELTPPRSGSRESLENFRKAIAGMEADAINITDSPGARLAMSSLAGSILVKQGKKEPIFQLTCRDRNSIGLQADLLGAAAFGVENVLALTGDPPHIGDSKGAKGVFEFNSVGLVKLIAKMNEERKTDFFIGAAISHHFPNLQPEIEKTKKKLEAGCRFFQTQPIFEMGQIEKFAGAYEGQNEGIRKKILVGVLALHERELINVLKSLPGIAIPEPVEKRVRNAKDARGESVRLALELCDGIKGAGFAGVHLLTMDDWQLFNEIAKQAR